MSYKAVAPLYRDRGFAPIPVKGKTPVPPGCTGREGVVSDEKVTAWCSDPYWGSQNVAIRAEGWIGIDIDDGYEYTRTDPGTGEVITATKQGATQIAELEQQLGPLPATISSTARGHGSPSRQLFFRVPDGIDFITKPASDIEIIQRSHRYAVVFPSIHPDTHQQYAWYGYDDEPLEEPPSIDDFEDLPQAWLEYLTAEPVATHGGFDGNIQAWLDILPKGEPSGRVRAFIDSIPTADFDHDEMTRLAFRLVRLGAENQPGVHQALDRFYAEWTRGPYDTPEYQNDFRVAIDGAIRKAGAPEEPTPTLVNMVEVANLLPEFTSANINWMQLLTTAPDVITEDTLHARRAEIASEGWLLGLPDQQVLTLVWNSRAGQTFQSHPNGLDDLWREIREHRSVLDEQQPDASAEVAASSDRLRYIEFLSAVEREAIGTADYAWWGTRYMEWVRARLHGQLNEPYHRMYMWTILSLVFSPLAMLVVRDEEIYLNIFGFIIGPTTSGKTEAKRRAKRVIKAVFSGNNPNIGGDATPNSLIEKLIERDGLSSWFNADEAHGLFKEMQSATWRSGLQEKWTDLYECAVPMMQRSTKRDISGIEATSYFVMTLQGTERGMTDVLDADFWTSGFLARFVWAIGDQVTKKTSIADEWAGQGLIAGERDDLPEQWAAEFRAVGQKLAGGTGPFVMQRTEGAQARLARFEAEVDRQVDGHRLYERLKPTSIRFIQNVMKCAALVALSEGTPLIEERHIVIALDQAGEWWANILHMAAATDETPFIRDVNRLEQYLRTQRGGQAHEMDIYKNSPRRTKKATDELLQQLMAEGRIIRDPQSDGSNFYRLRGGTV